MSYSQQSSPKASKLNQYIPETDKNIYIYYNYNLIIKFEYLNLYTNTSNKK